MIVVLKPYAEYKESELPWLGQVSAKDSRALGDRRSHAA